MANQQLERFIKLLKEIFELDKSDLDFGIYRVMNLRKNKIEDFLTKRLPEMVQETLAPFAQGGKDEIRTQMTHIEENVATMGMTIETLPDTAPMKQKYVSLQKLLAERADLSALEADVYSALYSFFSRYYEEGDFISKRRYKEGVYAIPYEGEEVKLYWANQDQYYIKTSENFKDYTFVFDGITVHFRMVDATTEQNNNKESKEAKRTFMLFTENEEKYPGLKTFEFNPEKAELIIRFVYNIPADKKKKYDEENLASINQWLISLQRPELNPLLMTIPTSKGKETTTLLKKHLKSYIAKNTFDYFIHKDLNGFLTRELDFFIKSEVMHLEDLDTENESRVEAYLAKIKAIKRVGKILIDFLAQLEDFQKKLWLKKKFVVETNWCITLDKIDEAFWNEIIANKSQTNEWIAMYAIDEAEGWNNPPTVEFLRHNQNLIVDTKYFSNTFKFELIESIPNLDEQTNGLMINSDNYHALNLLQNTYREKISGCYIDPPYNTDASEIIYKNGYKNSSWCTLLLNRLELGKKLLKNDSIQCVTIDDFQEHELYYLLNEAFGKENYLGTVCIKSNPQGRSVPTGFQISHEYGLFYGVDNAKIGTLERNEKQLSRYGESDEYGPFEWRNLRAQYSQESNTMVFPIFVKKDCSDFRIPKLQWDSINNKYETLEDHRDDEIVSLPIDETGRMRTWKYSIATISKDKETKFGVRLDRSGTPAVYYKGRMNDEGMQPFTFWDKPEYSASTFGTDVLADITGKGKFSYPKSINAVMDSLKIESKDKNAVFLDYFAGSGTTGHAVINLNRNDKGNRKYILAEMGEYFKTVTLPRVKKVIYSADWKNIKPQSRDTGVSHIMKYMQLESYEDALSNIELSEDKNIFPTLLGEEYMIHYMVDMESRDSLLKADAFSNPFAYTMKITEKNECTKRNIDLCETFNYLIGLTVINQSAITYFISKPSKNPAYEGAVDLVSDINGQFAFRQIEGTMPDGRRALVIWRTISDDIITSNAALDAYFTTYRKNAQDRKYDIIFVNGDNNLENLRSSSESWKVQITETEFKNRMFEEV